MPKVTKGHNSLNIFQNLFKSYSGRLHITTSLFIKFQGSSFNIFLDILLTILYPYFTKGHNSGKEHNPVEEKYLPAIFS